MKLSISNIGWKTEDDTAVYDLMKKYEYSGLEIAPTRIFSENPYGKLAQAEEWSNKLKKVNGFVISSMQSIWFGRQENIFGREEERQKLMEYTKQAIDFAEIIDCNNLVFGCPKNRILLDSADECIAIPFFKELSSYAVLHNTVIGMEANPPIYNTNYINNTRAAFDLIGKVNSDGFRLNLDIGTMIENREPVEELIGKVNLINHVHISEPGLKLIEKRKLHQKLLEILQNENYQGFISIEMKKTDSLQNIEKAMIYVKEVFQ